MTFRQRKDDVALAGEDLRCTDHRPYRTSLTCILSPRQMPVILVVDDSELNRQIAVERLAERGFVVAEAADGAEALREIEARRFDLVLLDVMMPGLDGLAVLRRIRELYTLAELPVIMATARGD